MEFIKKIFKREDIQKVILWGSARHVYEMKYMYDSLANASCVLTTKNNFALDGTIDERMLKEEVRKGASVIICDEISANYQEIISENQWIEGEHYISYQDCFAYLNPYSQEFFNTRKIAVWGIGDTEKNLSDMFIANQYDISVDLYLDSQKKVETYKGKPVRQIDELNREDGYFIIIASIYYFDIREKLCSMGYMEGEDFCSFSVFQTNPAKMMKQLVSAKSVPGFTCYQPYHRLFYAWFGAWPCCSTWVKYPIGNPASDTPEECWNSTVAKLYRLSMENQTYCFCDVKSCGAMGNAAVIEQKPTDYSVPSYIVLGLDPTCNLYCKSCRHEIQSVSGAAKDIRMKMADNIIKSGWLQKTKKLELSGTGEALASTIDRKILFEDVQKRKKISLITNANLLNETTLDQLINRYEEIAVNISIDAATEKTYGKIRRGGRWTVLQKNLENLAQKRRENKVQYVEIRMVVQKENYREIPAFVEMGEKFEFDQIVFTKLLNWDMFDSKKYHEECLIDDNEQMVDELKNILQQISGNPRVNIFEFKKYLG